MLKVAWIVTAAVPRRNYTGFPILLHHYDTDTREYVVNIILKYKSNCKSFYGIIKQSILLTCKYYMEE